MQTINNFLKKYLIYYDRNKQQEPIELEEQPIQYSNVTRIEKEPYNPKYIRTESKTQTITIPEYFYECGNCGTEFSFGPGILTGTIRHYCTNCHQMNEMFFVLPFINSDKI